jgi:starch-binding outer membrane protein, SusD/RagB family
MNRALLLPLLLAAAGCGLLDTDQPDIVEPGDVISPAGAQALRVGAISDFALANDGDGDLDEGITEGHVLLSGLMADEFVLSTTPPTEQEIDQRRVFENNVTLYLYYHNVQRARAAAETAAEALREFGAAPDEDPGIGEMLSLAGLTYVYLAESFCSGVAISNLEGDEEVFGEPQTTAQIFQTAVERFDAALAEPGVTAEESQEIFNLASVGRARALLNLNDPVGAAAAAAVVPTEFQYITEHADSPPRLQNAIFGYSTGFLWSVSDQEGGVGLPYRSAEDERVPFQDEETTGLDNTTPQFTLLKYPQFDSPVVIADGIEARLIEAEAQLRVDDIPGMTTTLNDLRDFQGLPPLGQPGNDVAATDLLFSERAFWLFATGHRLGDMRRLIRQYERDSESVFPGGGYIKGGQYGPDVNLPLPQEVRNNPNSVGCLDRNA